MDDSMKKPRGLPKPDACLIASSCSRGTASGSLIFDNNLLIEPGFLNWKRRTSSHQAGVVWTIHRILHERGGESAEFYKTIAALISSVSARFVGSHGRASGSAAYQYLINRELAGGHHQPNITWGGLSEVEIDATNAHEQTSGFVDGKAYPMHNNPEKMAKSIRKLYSYSANANNIRKQNQSPNVMPRSIPVMSLDGVSLAVGRVVPGVAQDVLAMTSCSRITEQTDSRHRANVDPCSGGFDRLLWFVYESSVMTLRTRAQALIESFRDGQGCAFLDQLGAVRIEAGQQLSPNAFSVKVAGQNYIAKLGLALPELETLGLTDLNQAANELKVLKKIPTRPGLQQLAHSGHYINEDSCLLLFTPCGAVVSPTLDAADLEKLTKQIGSVLVQIQRSGYAHGDVGRRNILAEDGHFSLIDYGHARDVNEGEQSIFRTRDLLCGSDEAILEQPVSMLGDWQSLLYTLKELSGSGTYPWAEAAAAGDRCLVVRTRMGISRNPSAFLNGLPPTTRALGELVCNCYAGRTIFSLDAFEKVLGIETKKAARCTCANINDEGRVPDALKRIKRRRVEGLNGTCPYLGGQGREDCRTLINEILHTLLV